MKVFLTTSYKRAIKKILKKNSGVGEKVIEKVGTLIDNPKSPSLKLHKLSGTHRNVWSISIAEDIRLLFVYEDKGIVLVDIGKHEDGIEVIAS